MTDLPIEVVDPEVVHAIEIVAMRVLNRLTGDADEMREMWENYPEIGEHDWERVVDRVLAIAANYEIDTATFVAAYEMLEKRAENV